MRKLKLDQLWVESFETANEGAERGTVHGHVVTSSRTGSESFGCFGSQGGILVQLDFRQPVEIEQIQAAVRAAGHDWRIKLFGPKNNYLIRIEGFEEPSGRPVHTRVREALSSRFQPTEYRVVRTESVGPARSECG